MGQLGQMICEHCGHSGPLLFPGAGMRELMELRRCRRCEGLVTVPYAHIAPNGYDVQMRSRRGRCANAIDARLTPCRSQALAIVVDDPDDDDDSGYEALTAPCHVCGGGVMRMRMVGIWD